MTVDAAASEGVVIAGLDGLSPTKMSQLATRAVTAAPGWIRADQADAAVAVAATCAGTDGNGNPCALNGAGTACAVQTGTCAYTAAASITCDSDDGTGSFTIVGEVGMTCTVPTEAQPGTVITGMSCSNTQTGSISCETLHTCDATTHHPSTSGISENGADLLAGTADDGVKCLADGAPLTLVVENGRPENPAGCSINYCNPPTTVPDGYAVADSTGASVVALGAATCVHDGTTGAAAAGVTSTNWWSEGTCTGTVNAGVYGKVDGATNDCAEWPRFVVTGQAADCPDGCTFSQTAATVTCTQAAGETDTFNQFVFTGCSQAKCNDLTGDDNLGSTAFAGASCGAGMTLKTELAFPCTGATCDQWDCCTDDDGCAATTNGFDPANPADDNQGPCFGTNSACMDVPAPGVGNICTCCDGDLHASFRDETEANGGCGGNIGFFGADVQSADATAVQGSCTACTPIANSAEAHTAPSGPTDVDEPAKMVTCTGADNSRAVACVTGAITVDNSANGVSDVCRLECPFTEVVALIDRLHIHTDGCAAVELTGTMTEAQQTAACEAVAGCYYTPVGANAVNNPATCRPIYAGCNAIAAGATNCDGGPKLSGDDNVLTSPNANPPVSSGDDVNACVFNDLADNDPSNDVCQYNPSTSATDYEDTITRCDALLATNWAHDLRDSCDATRACPLHGAIDASPPGMIAMVKAVYTAAGAPPAGTDTWAAGAAPTTAGLASTQAATYFLNDGDAVAMTDWEVCMNIRDAVLAAPTCSAGAGR